MAALSQRGKVWRCDGVVQPGGGVMESFDWIKQSEVVVCLSSPLSSCSCTCRLKEVKVKNITAEFSLLLPPPPPPPPAQQEALPQPPPPPPLPAGQRGGQRGRRGAWCCLMAVRTGRAVYRCDASFCQGSPWRGRWQHVHPHQPPHHYSWLPA